MPTSMLDALGRPLRSLRVSVTDRCNLRCRYCMPEPDYTWLPREELLDFEELARVVDRFADAGVDRLRFTGGEPLLRRDLPVLVGAIAARGRMADIALTTNGVRLGREAEALADAGLHRVTVSLDTLRPERFQALTRRDALDDAITGIDAARAAGLGAGLKIDTVVLAGTNDDEIDDLLSFAASREAEIRFIEYMDVGGATQWSPDHVISRATLLSRIRDSHGEVTPLPGRGSAPAERFRLPSGQTFGIIASTTAPFCGSCDRSRLTADGMWYRCLYARCGTDLKTVLRSGASDDALTEVIATAWGARTDRGAEQRVAAPERSALVPVDTLRRNPHLEMHTRGG